MAAGDWPASRRCAIYLARNCGLFRSLFRSPHTLRQRRHEIGHRPDSVCRRATLGVEAAAQGLDQCSADHRAVGRLRDSTGGFRRPDAEADTNRQLGMPLDTGHGLADHSSIRAGTAGNAGNGDVIDKA